MCGPSRQPADLYRESTLLLSRTPQPRWEFVGHALPNSYAYFHHFSLFRSYLIRISAPGPWPGPALEKESGLSGKTIHWTFFSSHLPWPLRNVPRNEPFLLLELPWIWGITFWIPSYIFLAVSSPSHLPSLTALLSSQSICNLSLRNLIHTWIWIIIIYIYGYSYIDNICR